MSALVESPLQLLCALEAHAAGHTGPHTTVLARSDVPALAPTVHAVHALGLPEGSDVRLAAPTDHPGSGEPDVVGDPFSGVFQAALIRRPSPRQLVIVDDGLGTLDVARRLVANQPMVRLAAPGGPVRRMLGRMATHRLRGLAAAGQLRLCTMLPLANDQLRDLTALGVDVTSHSFGWLASRPEAAGSEAITEETVVVGSGLVADRFVHADDYAAWLLGLAADGPVRYIPHRRHDPLVTALFDRPPGVQIDSPGAPVEIRLRSLQAGQRVVSLPSTSAVTLTRLLAPRGVDVRTHRVPDDWWTPRASAPLRAHLTTAADLAHETRRRLPEVSLGERARAEHAA